MKAITARAVTVIPPTIKCVAVSPNGCTKKKRIAAYARVSTDSEEQMTSYEARSITIQSTSKNALTGGLLGFIRTKV